jgi:hypothetical protein
MMTNAAEAVGRTIGRAMGTVRGNDGRSGGAGRRLQDAFLDAVKDAYDAEKQLVKALPKLAKAATRGSAPSARSRITSKKPAVISRR